MVFNLPQSNISFTLGDVSTTYAIRYYSNSVTGGLISSLNIETGIGVHTLVNVASATKNIRRIEV